MGCKNSKLPVIAKGILSGEDAKAAVECGVSAIMVSNHGGRLIEKVVSTSSIESRSFPEDADVAAKCGVLEY
ncbi:hypothetical protein CEXT_477001 [Caerostris extrusa]|uniref:FMN-dependent dehydrogenase domain-containing protein n=1 Tax=Caerostris extrusa TaxID=172846 RepID=A0AAV4U9Y9_CAEEX|nr:hypothetical protein CEXT_477001 [Caerostris extrusa]